MKLISFLKKIKKEYLIIGTFILFLIILRTPSLFEPHWYSDEGLFASAANMLRNGKYLYKDVYTNYAPGIFFVYYLSSFANNLLLLSAKLASLLASIFSVILIYKITKSLFSRKIAVISSVFSSILLGLPLIDANIANPENFTLLFTLLGIFLTLKKTKKKYFLSGLSFGISILFAKSSIFDFLVIITYLILIGFKNDQKVKLIKNLSKIIFGFLIPSLIITIFFANIGILNDFQILVLNYYISNIFKSFNNSLGFIFLDNNIYIRTILLIISTIFSIHLSTKKKITKSKLFLVLWTIFISYSILLPQKSYSHFLLQAVPIFSINTALLAATIFQESNTKIKVYRFLTYIFTIFFVLNLFSHGNKITSNINCTKYYSNFIQYLSGKIDTNLYVKFFKQHTYQTYRLNSYIAQNYPNEKLIYIWTNNPWIYQIADLEAPTKYLLSYQAESNFENVKIDLESKQPELIIISDNSQESEQLETFLENNYYIPDTKFEGHEIFILNKPEQSQIQD